MKRVLRRALRERADVLQHAQMDAVDRRVGPPSPILRGIEAVLIPARPFEQRPVARERDQPELPRFGDQGKRLTNPSSQAVARRCIVVS